VEIIIIDEFLDYTKSEFNHQIANFMNHNSKPQNVYNFIRNKCFSKSKIKWIPYSQITNLAKIAEGGFGIIYKANRLNPNSNQNKIFAIKRFLYPKYFFNEVIVYYYLSHVLLKIY